MVGIYYAGRLQSNNKQFDACQSGKPFKFRLGAGEVIKVNKTEYRGSQFLLSTPQF